ncbi:2-nitropropane dioxygenase NPD [Macrophomina phaseolina MS6]|uniref:2-nitropropane dioxygenase NPD n=2 Tax=Macrophomina phaseolina TaxID=35725 RepID=K2RUU4_MACPH|nr:2-nitropropane dioxygenase NPD [Macrophomina phaseolina MS6]
MGGFAGPELAASVTNAGGLGFIAGGYSLSQLPGQLSKFRSLATKDGGAVLPVGIGFLCFGCSADEAATVVREYKPAIAWLFCPNQLSDYATWAQHLRDASPETAIWVQTGSVTAALEIARTVRPEVLVMQGLDAGGHGFEKGAGIISLLPEAADALQEAGFGDIPLVAAGGIADSRGAAAALALGAAGVVMGTRFLASNEVEHPGYRAAILGAQDGGQATARSKIFDEVREEGNNWPVLYDGRGLVNKSYADFAAGKPIEDIRKLHSEALKGKDAGFGEVEKRVTVWAGTGVGLVREVLPAGKIVEETRNGARRILGNLQSQL